MPDKATLRNKLKKIRKNLTKEEVVQKSEIIQNKIINSKEFKDAKTIHCYIHFGNEVKTDKIIKTALDQDKIVIIATQSSEEVKNYQLKNLEELEKIEAKTIKIQDLPEFVKAGQVELALVPLLAFDNDLNRLGLGSGWYDRFLSTLKPTATKVGLAFDCQRVISIPKEDHDVRLDMIINET